MRKEKDRNIGQHGEAAQLTKKYRNVKNDLPKIARPNLIETETVLLEDPLPKKKQQEVFDPSSKEKKKNCSYIQNWKAINYLTRKQNKMERNVDGLFYFQISKKNSKMNFMPNTGFNLPYLDKN